MRKHIFAIAAVIFTAAPALAADEYAVDLVHSSMTFKVAHLGIAEVHGRFNEFSGKFTFNESDPSKSSFTMIVKVESIDTANKDRDKHLRAEDFFNVAKHTEITFKSTAVRAVKMGYEVEGQFTMVGVTKPITFIMTGGKTIEFKGEKHIGFSTEMTIKRSDFGLKTGIPAIGDEVHIAISFEGVKK
jgi:polyisoprenoid-binding protein YceI